MGTVVPSSTVAAPSWSSTQTGLYRPSNVAGTDGKKGSIDVDGKTIQFDGLTPVDVANFAAWTVDPAGLNDNLTLANGVNLTSGVVAVGTHPALVISGTSGGTTIENIALWDISTLTVNTALTLDGSDSLTISSADGTAATGANIPNLAILTGSSGTDTLAINGPVNLPGNLSLNVHGTVSESGSIVAAGLELLGTGPYTLTNTGNNVTTLAGNVTGAVSYTCLLYTSPSPRDGLLSRMPSSA